MKIPGDVKVYESEVFTIWMDENGILCLNTKPIDISVKNAKRSFEIIEETCKYKKVCCLADVSHIHYVNKTTRKYATEFATRQFTAMAVISSTAFGVLVANTVITMNRPSFPIKIFSRKEEAIKWLKSYLGENNNKK